MIMNSVWGPELYDMAAWNTAQVEEVDVELFDFMEMLDNDVSSSIF